MKWWYWLIDLPSLSLFKGDGYNFGWIGKVSIESMKMIILDIDIPKLNKEGIQMGDESFNNVYELTSSSMIEW